jgi:heat shock protein HtpX
LDSATLPRPGPAAAGLRHRLLNQLQTVLLILTLLGLATLAGSLLFGESGLWMALGMGVLTLLIEPAAASRLTLRLYHARPIHPAEAPGLWQMAVTLAARAGLPDTPKLHHVPSGIVNAFATGSRRQSAIALTDGLLRALTPRELAGVLAHEMAHIVNGDLRVMGLADSISRLTYFFAIAAHFFLLLSLPALLLGVAEIHWPALLLLAFSPQLALLAQLGLSRVREFDADRVAVELTGDPAGLASALAKIEQASRSWRAWLLPGWGNPEPSWLRTHPQTADRIARLKALASPQHGPWATGPASDLQRPGLPPRWRVGGLWL